MRIATRLSKPAVAGFAYVFALACLAQDAPLEAGRSLWQAAGLTDYEYGYQKYCDCHPESPPETIVTVRAGAVVAVRHRPQNYSQEVPAEQRNLQFYWTVDGLFALLESAHRRGAQVRVDYHETLGYPTQIYIDYDADFIGDELDLRLTRVAAIDR
ncbi:MAG TPA: DUF6174 domain-containing protein [Gammaproteobacteria bacterium]|nr:DUF6174 domain-containing protein [Gammaproteobacteria bacterium]